MVPSLYKEKDIGLPFPQQLVKEIEILWREKRPNIRSEKLESILLIDSYRLIKG
jgi:hypothetical protein